MKSRNEDVTASPHSLFTGVANFNTQPFRSIPSSPFACMSTKPGIVKNSRPASASDGTRANQTTASPNMSAKSTQALGFTKSVHADVEPYSAAKVPSCTVNTRKSSRDKRIAPPRVTPFSCDHPESTLIALTLATKLIDPSDLIGKTQEQVQAILESRAQGILKINTNSQRTPSGAATPPAGSANVVNAKTQADIDNAPSGATIIVNGQRFIKP